MTRRIETEEQYQESLLWLVKEAERLENEEEIHDPLIRPEDKANLLRRYNIVEAGILEYQKRMNESKNNPPSPPVEQEEPKQEVKKAASNYADFLD